MKKKVLITGTMQEARDYALDIYYGRLKPAEEITPEDIAAAGEKDGQSNEKSASQDAEPVTKSMSTRRGNKNALMHGVYSADLVLPWESEEDLRKLHEDLKAEYQPDGCSEEQSIVSLTWFMWLQQRANNMAQLQSQAGMPPPCGETTPWHAIVQYQRQTTDEIGNLNAQAETWMKELRKLSEDFHAQSCSAAITTPAGKQAQTDFAKLSSDFGRMHDLFEKKALPAIRNLALRAEQRIELFSKVYDPDAIEQLLRILGKTESQMEKALWRLTAIKEFKKVRAPSLIPPQRPRRPTQVEKKEIDAEVDVQIDPIASDDNTPDKK